MLFGASSHANAAGTPITIKNLKGGSLGVFDPSLAQDATRPLVWMSFTAVDPSTRWPSQNRMVESIHLAYSSDSGQTWTDVGGPIAAFADVTLSGNPAGAAGTWVNEVSQLIYDPAAPAAERYKIIWQRYLVVNGQGQFNNTWLSMKMADSPEHLPAANEKKIFSGFAYNPENNFVASNTHPPVGGAAVTSLDWVAPAVNSCVFTEPGMLSTPTALYMSVSCMHLMDGNQLVVLMKCGAPCDPTKPNSWSYVSTLFNKASAPAGFDDGFQGSSLFQGANGSFYVTVTAAKNNGAPWPGYYEGCKVYSFSDLAHGVLSKGAPTNIDGISGSFNGACAFHPANKKGGVMYDQLNTSNRAPFQIYASGVTF